MALPAPLPTLSCAPGHRRPRGSCSPAWGLPDHPQPLNAGRRSAGSVSRLQRCPAEGHGSSWMLCLALGTSHGHSSRPGLLPTEMAFLESSACCRLAAPGAPATPWPPHRRCHQPEGKQGGEPAVPGLLPSQNKTCWRAQLCLGLSVKGHVGVPILPCSITRHCQRASGDEGMCTTQFGYHLFFNSF